MSSQSLRRPCAAVFLVAACSILAIAFEAHAETYYLSSSAGSDQDSGTSETRPWQTLGHLRSRLGEGDTVRLRRGDVFRDSLAWSGGTGMSLTFLAYGDQALPKPVISGSIVISDWTRHQGNIWKATAPVDINHLFVDNSLMLIARYPNRGWFRIRAFHESRIQSPQLLDHPRNADGYFNGATVRLRAHSWWHELHTARSYQASDGSFEISGTLSPYLPGWAFYLDGKLSELDTAGEWYYDDPSNTVYLWAPDNADPNALIVEGSVRSIGLKCRANLIRDICFRHQTEQGLVFWGVDPIIERCRFEGIERKAVSVGYSTQGGVVRHCVFEDNIGVGISVIQDPSHRGVTIEYDTLYRTAMIGGYERIAGKSNVQSSAVIVFKATGARVSHCLIEETGYSAIIFIEDDNIADHNIIRRAMSRLNDGGAIYVNCNRSIIKHNIITECGVLDEACHPAWDRLHHGIWPEFLGDWRGTVIDSNTAWDCVGSGLFLPNNFECRVRGNTFFNNKTQMSIKDIARNPGGEQNHTITNNVFYACDRFQSPFRFAQGVDYGTLRDNYYCNPFLDHVISTNSASLTIEEWQEEYTWADESAKTDFVKLAEDSSLGLARLFVNEQERARTITLPAGRPWRDLDGNPVSGAIELAPFSSLVLIPMDSSLSTGHRLARHPRLEGVRMLRVGQRTSLQYSLRTPTAVRVFVYNAAGRQVRRLFAGKQPAGDYCISWDGATVAGRPASAGMYLMVLATRTNGAEKRVTLPVVLGP